jgi:hypothetical protein
MSESLAGESIHQRDFNSMAEYLISIGAETRPVAGTIVDLEDNIALRAIYFLDTQQTRPTIIEFSDGDDGGALTRLALDENGEPLGSRVYHRFSWLLIHKIPRLVDSSRFPSLQAGPDVPKMFSDTYLNVIGGFEPNPIQPQLR